MDLHQIIRQLQEEKRRLDQVMSSLESLSSGGAPPPRTVPRTVKKQPARKSTRGRKHMSEEERALVSERMRTYWAARREAGKDETAI